MGCLSVLNTGAGDIEIAFNQHDEGEREKAVKMLTDMQKRGYAILMRLEDNSYIRVQEIDPARGRYIIQLPADMPVDVAGPAAEEETCGIIGREPHIDRDLVCALPPHKGGTHKDASGVEWKGKRGARRAGKPARRGGRRTRRVSVPVEHARVTGVARSAGG